MTWTSLLYIFVAQLIGFIFNLLTSAASGS